LTTPSYSANFDGWQEVKPGGDTLCARGGEFAFFVYPGNSDKVVIDFIGGGGCWDAETCKPGSQTFTDSIDNLREQADRGILYGVYDKSIAENPYRDWTHVAIPYCTGDVHWGENDKTYTDAKGQSFTIYHRGATNVKAALNWVQNNIPAANNIHVTGCSAGAYGSIFWTPAIVEMYPAAQISQFGDAGAGVISERFRRSGFPNWNIDSNVPHWVAGLDPASTEWETLQISEIYSRIGAHYPNTTLSQHNTNNDLIQQFFFLQMGGNPREWRTSMRNSLSMITSEIENFNYFIAPNDSHCSITESYFYDISSQGIMLKDWLKAIMQGDPVSNVDCGTDCNK
jgi:hypothetical protein